ncbi:MAG TPA: polysaccharide biosynthesis/export family protein, partial [Pyrinomonadaceae bacterium]|nr:polysaccharide biosynthesis/export family protein [Pyrinomonadaceae bacterium]
RVANHAEKPKAAAGSKGNSAAPINQSGSEPRWGNTAVVTRPGPGDGIAPLQNSTIEQSPAVNQAKPPARKLVQQTSLISDPTKSSPIVGNAGSPRILTGRAPVPTVVYNVGVGDVLDIRLSNLPTRESTLYTVLKSGLLEYPLLNGPLSVAGMTTDEIGRLLSSEIKVIKSARVSVSVRDYASHSIVITGLVDSPGKKNMRREAMPLFAVLAESLPRTEASLVTIVRNGNSQTISRTDEAAMSTLVLPGDVIKVSAGNSTAAKFVYVGGDVASRGEKEFRDGMTLTQVLLSAGGVNRGTRTSVRVARRDSSGFLKSSQYNLRLIEEGKSQDPVLQAGDRIEVTQGM